MGNGPYESLSSSQRRVVVDTVTERYLDLGDSIARYEFGVHVKMANRGLWEEVEGGGKLKDRGGERCKDDTWLEDVPEWRREGGEEEEVR